jgi:hypothetical protein
MIAQDIGFPVLFLKERCSYSYSRLRKKCWGINRQARAREVYESKKAKLNIRDRYKKARKSGLFYEESETLQLNA